LVILVLKAGHMGPSRGSLILVIAKRAALWRSRPARLDCRAPAGFAM